MDSVQSGWTAELQRGDTLQQNKQATPNYWSSSPQTLVTETNIHSTVFGTGEKLWADSIAPAITTANEEVIIVTCFWAQSATLTHLNNALIELSSKAKRENKKIRVRICFSSCSLFQKLFHTRSLKGQKYPPKTWQSKLGLPEASKLTGLDLDIKSIFVVPFSVMHPKFVIIDRKRAFLPSCNISWENWFEGCVECSGPVVEQFLTFWKDFWASDMDRSINTASTSNIDAEPQSGKSHVPSVFLPSPHHVNPDFNFPWAQCKRPPPTPLNIYLLTLFARAEKSIRFQTPNVTSPPVLSALKDAVRRGVDITILTSERLMVLEQLVTAGTTTSRCVKKLIKEHQSLVIRHNASADRDMESGLVTPRVGNLRISYFVPEKGTPDLGDVLHAVQSHLKLTIVDDRVTVFGSGNLDRASWFTSQELGLALMSAKLTKEVTSELDRAMEGKSKLVYDSFDSNN